MPENFWTEVDDIQVQLPSRPVVTKSPSSTIQRFKDYLVACGGSLRSPMGELVADIGEAMDMDHEDVRGLLKSAAKDGWADVVQADRFRVYAVTLKQTTVQSTPTVISSPTFGAQRNAEADRTLADDLESIRQSERKAATSLPERFSLKTPNDGSEAIAAAVAEAMWQRYEWALGEIGRLSNLLAQKEEAITALQRSVQAGGGPDRTVRDLAAAMLEADIKD